MAKITFYRDDFDGTEDSTVQPRRIPLESGTLNVDLSDANYEALTEALMKAIEPYIEKAPEGAWTPRDTGGSDENRLIREWGRANGYDVSPRGRISEDLMNAYREAHKSPQQPVEPASNLTPEDDSEVGTHDESDTDNGSREPATAAA